MFIVIHVSRVCIKKTTKILKRRFQKRMIKYEGDRTMFLLFGRMHRINGPAFMSSTLIQWFVKGKEHRQDGPAFISITRFGWVGIIEWWVNGKKHRIDSPAAIVYFNSGTPHLEQWFINGLKTKEILYLRNKDIISETFFLNGKRIRKQFKLLN